MKGSIFPDFQDREPTKPRKYRKKPVVIEAVQWDGDPRTFAEILPWLADTKVNQNLPEVTEGRIVIPTLEGNMLCEPGDWIIKGIKGELYPCQDEIFKATYEVVNET